MPTMSRSTRRVASYRHAIDWIALNDDTDWVEENEDMPSVTAVLVADIFGRTTEEVTKDLKRVLAGIAA